MENGNIDLLKKGLMTNPFLYEDKLVEELALLILPYSTGIEIECSFNTPNNYDTTFLNLISCDFNGYEQRVRIKNGIDGLKSLYLVCQELQKYANFNTWSGIHYHIDCTDWIHWLDFDKVDKEYILSELDKWGYKGRYNTRDIGRYGAIWLRRSHFPTLEFRIGNMSFDYKVLIKQISHACELTKYIKGCCIDPNIRLEFLKKKLDNIKVKPVIEKPEIDIREQIKSRKLT